MPVEGAEYWRNRERGNCGYGGGRQGERDGESRRVVKELQTGVNIKGPRGFSEPSLWIESGALKVDDIGQRDFHSAVNSIWSVARPLEPNENSYFSWLRPGYLTAHKT